MVLGLFKARGSSVAGTGEPTLMTPQEAASRLSKGQITLVDVREDDEWRAGYIPGAMHAPLSRFASEAARLPQDKPVVLYCLSGMRSARALSEWHRIGLAAPVRNLEGGIAAWRKVGLPG